MQHAKIIEHENDFGNSILTAYLSKSSTFKTMDGSPHYFVISINLLLHD